MLSPGRARVGAWLSKSLPQGFKGRTSSAYTALLVQGVTSQTVWNNAYASAPNINSNSLDAWMFNANAMQSNQVAANNAALPGFIAMLRSVDGDPAAGPLPDMTGTLVNRNLLATGVLGTLFGGAGAANYVFGASPQQVAAANELGAEVFNMAGASQWKGVNGPGEASVISEPWTSQAVSAGVQWGQGIQNQGMPWENYLAAQLPAGSQLPPNFKTFDFYDPMTQTAISAKTLDTQGSSYLSSSTSVYSTLEGYVDSVVNFTSYTLSKRTLNPSMISNRELQVAVPAQTTPQQWEQINQAVQYGQSQGVKVIVTPVQ